MVLDLLSKSHAGRDRKLVRILRVTETGGVLAEGLPGRSSWRWQASSKQGENYDHNLHQ
jgi:hypothetical protein